MPLTTKIQKAIFHADAVICENHRLAKEVLKINRNTYVVPNAQYLQENGDLHRVNLDRVEIFSEVLITR